MSRPILLGMGTRPEIIKMAPVYHALRAAGQRVCVLHTGQHDSMATPLYEFFEMRPDHAIALERGGDTLAHLSAALLTQAQRALAEIAPAALLVHGDTSTAAMLSLAAYYAQLPVAHVEAGLRSGCIADPFPEELNRQLIARIARWHFAPTARAVSNLRQENVPPSQIHLVGNSVVDATHWAARLLDRRADRGAGLLPPLLAGLEQAHRGRSLVIVTAHRRENWGDGIARIAAAVMELVARHDGLLVVWPVHANPTVRDAVHAAAAALHGPAQQRLLLTEPLNYPAMMLLLRRAWLALTDSGGIQEEAVSHGVPVLVLRETTERPEVLSAGAGRLVGTQSRRIVEAVEELHGDSAAYRKLRSANNPFGDGQTGARIARHLQAALQQQARAA